MCLNKYKIAAISDLHGKLPVIKDQFDLLLLAGDLVELTYQRSKMLSDEWFTSEFVEWINNLPFKDDNSKVLWIAGNHECAFYDKPKEHRKLLGLRITELTNNRAIYLEDSLFDFNGVKVYGTPWCKIFGHWAFMKSDEELTEIYNNIPENVDILLTHDAPYGTSDMCFGWYTWGRTPIHIGNEPLRDAILVKNPKLNIHGHLHSANHECELLNNTKVYCVSYLDEGYNSSYEVLWITDF